MLIARRKDEAEYPQLWDGLVGAWYPGAGPSGTRLYDFSGRDNHGTLTNGPVWGTSTGRQALSFDASDDFVSVNSTATQTSMSFWIYSLGSPDRYIIDWRTGGGANAFLYRSGTLFPSSGTCYVNGIQSTTLPVNVWSSVVINGINSTLSTTPVRIGSHNSITGFCMSSSIADMMWFSRQLSVGEINLLARRPGIAFELAPRRFYSLPPSSARLRRILTGAT